MNSLPERLALFQAIASLVLSWPVVVMVILMVFRKRLLQLLDRLISGEHGRVELPAIRTEVQTSRWRLRR
jgi:hypothetical protein